MIIESFNYFNEIFFSEFKRGIEHNEFQGTFKSEKKVIFSKVYFLFQLKAFGGKMKNFKPNSMLIIHFDLSDRLVLSTENIPEIIVLDCLT